MWVNNIKNKQDSRSLLSLVVVTKVNETMWDDQIRNVARRHVAFNLTTQLQSFNVPLTCEQLISTDTVCPAVLLMDSVSLGGCQALCCDSLSHRTKTSQSTHVMQFGC